jgi:hypothetical protein
MIPQERYLDIFSLKGELLFSILIREHNAVPQNGNGHKSPENKTNGSNNGKDEPVTGPQLKLLFRIMAEKGFVRDSAKLEILKLFKVEEIAEIKKLDVIKMIDSLLTEAKGKER